MGRPRIGQERKTFKDYLYFFPENLEVSKHLSPDDKIQIAFRTGYCLRLVHYWCAGKRQNRIIGEYARKVVRLNQAKQRKMEKIHINTDHA